MSYPPCPYPPRTHAGGTSVVATHVPQTLLIAEYNTNHPGDDPLIEPDWHHPHPESNFPCQLDSRNTNAENISLTSLESPESSVASPLKVAIPSSPDPKETAPVSSSSASTTSDDPISSVNTLNSSVKAAGTKRTYDKALQSQPSITASYNARRSNPPQAPKNSRSLIHRKTQRSVSASHRELSKPFRSPLISSPSQKTPSPQSTPLSAGSRGTSISPSSFNEVIRRENGSVRPQLHSPLVTAKRAGAASRPFKSPLSTSHSKTTLPSIDRRKIQLLEKKLATLHQARKYRRDGSTNHLQELTQKWKNAAREAAQELWTLAHSGFSNAGVEGSGNTAMSRDEDSWKSWGYGNEKEDDVLAVLKGGSKNGGSKDNWGWDDAEVTLVEGHEHDNFLSAAWEPPSPATLSSQLAKPRRRAGGETKPVLSDDLDPVSYSRSASGAEIVGGRYPDASSEEGGGLDAKIGECNIGTMLVQLGIAKETLGWNDAEEDFFD